MQALLVPSSDGDSTRPSDVLSRCLTRIAQGNCATMSRELMMTKALFEVVMMVGVTTSRKINVAVVMVIITIILL